MMLDTVGGSAECSILCHHCSNNEQQMQGMCNKRVSHLLSPWSQRRFASLSSKPRARGSPPLVNERKGASARWQQQPMPMPDPEVAHVFTSHVPPLPLPTSANQCKFFSTGDQTIANPLLFSLNTLTNR